MRRNDVASTSFRHHVPTRSLINQCQIITFLILKSDNIENSRIELKETVLPVPSNQIRITVFYPSTWYICDFFLFHIEIEGKYGKYGWIIGEGGEGGAKGMLAPPSQILGGRRGAWPPLVPPLLIPMTYYSHHTVPAIKPSTLTMFLVLFGAVRSGSALFAQTCLSQ